MEAGLEVRSKNKGLLARVKKLSLVQGKFYVLWLVDGQYIHNLVLIALVM